MSLGDWILRREGRGEDLICDLCLAFLSGVPLLVLTGCLLELGEGSLKGKVCVQHWRWRLEERRRAGCSSCSVTELGEQIWRRGERAGDIQLAYLLPQLAAWFPGNAAHFQGPCEQLLMGISAEKGLVALPGFHTQVI